MRILEIRFANLNSLAGQWCIDFTHPAFIDDGLFAITGPTGAGKSTVLDALCLALYGRTPRLERVNKTSNDIMSRHTGECFAEVSFESGAGRFRCHWGQHRARRRPDGELQAPKHEIADADSGAVLQTGLRDVALAVESTSGMDFERFTRSMLLAQGGFAAFLQAPPDQRAPLLEQITGTAIYSEISMRVHGRRGVERARLEQLQTQLDACEPLAPEDEAALQAALERDSSQERALIARVMQQREVLDWRRGLAQLQTQQGELAGALQESERERAAFAPASERLQRANRALELDAAHGVLTALRITQASEDEALRDARAREPAIATAAQRATEAARAAVAERDSARTRHFEQQPLLREVRALDQRIESQGQRRDALAAELAERRVALDALQSERQQSTETLRSLQAELADITGELGERAVDAQLLEELGALRQRVAALQGVARELQTRRGDLEASEEHLARARASCEAKAQALETLRHRLLDTEQALHEHQGQRSALLRGQSASEWRGQQGSMSDAQRRLEGLEEALQVRRDRQEKQARLSARLEALDRQSQELGSQLTPGLEQLAALDERIRLQETQRLLLQRIDSLEAAREQLQSGEPCPLCGALEHPFADDDALPSSDGTQRALDALRGERSALLKTLDALREDRVAANTQRDTLRQYLADGDGDLQQAQGRVATLLASLPELRTLAPDAPELEGQLSERREAGATALAELAGKLKSIEELDGSLEALVARREQERNDAARAEAELASSRSAEASRGLALRHCREEVSTLQERQRRLLAELRERLLPFGWGELALRELDAMLDALSERRDSFMRAEERRRDLERDSAALGATERAQSERLVLGHGEYERGQDDLQALEQELTRQREKRSVLLGDRCADAEETALHAAAQAADAALETARQLAADSAQAQRDAAGRIETLGHSLKRRAQLIEADSRRFNAELTARDFADETAYQAACLPAEERQELAARERQLAECHSALQGQHDACTARLRKERDRGLSEDPAPVLDAALQESLAEQRALQQRIGASQQRLKENEQLKRARREQIAALDAQRRECRRWDELHALIGSADGKKYRNFAQGLTFELMVGHANRQLQKMTDRYLLLHASEQPLELNVVDNYQGGEIRSTKNLSGGESFLVSLALALGLASMASRNLRVDSLFLDEGFGTLDEEALDTALETLAGLQQEGKLIGVISHVGMLKERIATQIVITPRSGGRSVLSGPGCGSPSEKGIAAAS